MGPITPISASPTWARVAPCNPIAFPPSISSTTDDEETEAISKTDISVFPLATPLIAGPGAMGAAILLMANQNGDLTGQAIIISSLLAILLLTFISLLLASKIQNLLGITGMHFITRVMGVLLAALAAQFIFMALSKVVWLPSNKRRQPDKVPATAALCR